MSNEIVEKTESSAIVPISFTESQVDLIKKTVAKGTTNDELALFLYTCKRTGLDPLIRQIYAVKRNCKDGATMSIQTGIDGYRLIAERTGKYAPGREPMFNENNGTIISATAYVNKLVGGEWHEVAATAFFSEYNAGSPMWVKMPHAMLAKCAEALALRKSFPAEMAGVYTSDEMAQADKPTAQQPKPSMPKPVSENGKISGFNIGFYEPKAGKKSASIKVGETYYSANIEKQPEIVEIMKSTVGAEVEISATPNEFKGKIYWYIDEIIPVTRVDAEPEQTEETPSLD